MKKIFNFIKKNILGFLLGVIFCSVLGVVAESIQSNEVLYDNSNSYSSYNNVQDVLDNVYEILNHANTGFSLLVHTSDLASNFSVGLYRYKGTTADNYICFGTNNKNTCLSDTDKYMYRIIGINTSNQLKLIKMEALNTAYQWNSGEISWPNSPLFTGINGSYYLTNSYYFPDNTWSNKIAFYNWPYYSTGWDSFENVEAIERSAPTVNAKIGLIQFSEKLDGNISWIDLTKNDSGAPSTSEWMMTHANYSGYTWCIKSSGGSDWVGISNSFSVRPVFYLNAGERITSGNGTITDPYMLS